MAAVTGHVDHFIAGRPLPEGVEMVQGHTVVDAVPEALQDETQRAHHRMRIVGGDLTGIGVGLLGRRLVTALFLVGLGGNRGAYRIGAQQIAHQRAPV